MKRYAAQYVLGFQSGILSRQTMTFDDRNIFVSHSPMEGETASTFFFNGILCPPFRLIGKNQMLTPAEATELLRQKYRENGSRMLTEYLSAYVEMSAWTAGAKNGLWCIEMLDLKTLQLQENTVVYSVLP